MKNNDDINNGKNGFLMIILLAIVALLVLIFPRAYDFMTKLSMPKIENVNTEEQQEAKEISEDILETIHYPLMRNSIYNANTYYSLDKFTINDLSNEDILLNAFLTVQEVNMTPYEGVGSCTNISKKIKSDHLQLRIKNTISKNINYTFNSFYVPEDLNSNYVGSWYYDAYNKRFIYNGLCSSQATNTRYYNLEELIKVEYENKNDIVAYYYVGFAKVENNNYIMYRDANMTEEIKNGTFSTVEDLNKQFKQQNNKKIYKYTFKMGLCKYDYCLYEGKWVNEL